MLQWNIYTLKPSNRCFKITLKKEIPKNHWLQLPVWFVSGYNKLNHFWVLDCWKKKTVNLNKVTLGSGKLWWTFYTILWHFLDLIMIQQNNPSFKQSVAAALTGRCGQIYFFLHLIIPSFLQLFQIDWITYDDAIKRCLLRWQRNI